MDNNTAAAEKEKTVPSPIEETAAKPDTAGREPETVDDFINRMSAPRKENKRAFDLGGEEDPEGDGEQITDNDEDNLEHFNFSEEHRATALFFIGVIDSAMGWIGTLATGQDPERYQRFAKKEPPGFYVDSTAALVKKYHARLSLEMMFISALMMVYGPAVATIRKDRKILKEKAMEEKIRAQSSLAIIP